MDDNMRSRLDNVAAVHKLAIEGLHFGECDINEYIPADISMRILKCLTYYKGKENKVKIWEYVSMKEYINSKIRESQNKKIINEIHNRTNLILKNNS